MARTREFDVNDILDRAMYLFWEKGYVETSVRDLVKCTGVAHAGLYSAFGDKEGLFKAAVRKYCLKIANETFGALDRSHAGRAEVEHVFELIRQMNKDGRLRNGCMLLNTAVEFPGTDEELKDLVLGNFNRLEEGLSRALTHAVAAGEVRADLPVKRIAISMATTIHGLAALSRAGISFSIIEEAVQAALEQLD
ncbi:transcriptional regulator, TetR family [Nitrosomonas cryotolerans]|uniref:Transcriptional regulator, TetR family n=1 Tax=Nitrosomonas cryotolerans ATCC 49181 TaxID=1131553 RepID=A0A1N6GB22_9PROT|nr:TetR/AcrR family transcriptional regulator [Nitrosomonas cryotolerans]SFQ06035.1 transcriptional regulator, TetR family [Nitrosomonas cryotolerans]SIO04718.1 transcriptional regulator, TetR family [Nitrosomonas cryotolerans ATCC 49181]